MPAHATVSVSRKSRRTKKVRTGFLTVSEALALVGICTGSPAPHQLAIGSSWANVSVTADISGDQSDRNGNIFSFFAPAAWNFCSWGTTNALDWFHVWKWRLNVLFESPTPWKHTYTQYMGVQFTLGWHCGSHTRAPKRFHFVMMVLMKKRFEFLT